MWYLDLFFISALSLFFKKKASTTDWAAWTRWNRVAHAFIFISAVENHITHTRQSRIWKESDWKVFSFAHSPWQSFDVTKKPPASLNPFSSWKVFWKHKTWKSTIQISASVDKVLLSGHQQNICELICVCFRLFSALVTYSAIRSELQLVILFVAARGDIMLSEQQSTKHWVHWRVRGKSRKSLCCFDISARKLTWRDESVI